MFPEEKRMNRWLVALILAAVYALGGGTVSFWPEPKMECPKCGAACQKVLEMQTDQ